MKAFVSVALSVALSALAACGNPGVVKLSPDTYMLVKEDHAGVFGSGSSLEAGVIQEANAFAASQGKIAIPLYSHYKPMGPCCAEWASFEYQFRVVDQSDPEARRTALAPRPDIVEDKTEKVTVDVHNTESTRRPNDI